MQSTARDFNHNVGAALANPNLQDSLAKLKVGFSERRRQAVERLPEFEAPARRRARHQEPHARQSRFLSRGVRAQGHGAGRPCPLGADGGRCTAHHHRALPERRCAHDRQVEIDDLGRDRHQRSSRGAGHRADRDRSRRIHHPAAARAAEPHHRAGGAPDQGPGRRHVSRASQRAGLHQAADRAQRPGRRGAPRAAAEIPRCRCRHHRRQFPGRRDRLVDAGDQRRQRRSVQHAAQDAHRPGQHREGDSDARGRGRAAARAGALGDRPGILDLHDAQHRPQARRRSRRAVAVSRRHPRQRPLVGAGHRDAGDAALHPLRRLHEPLPGLRRDRRPCLWLGLSRPDRRGADAAAHRRRGGEQPAQRLDLLRPLRERLPGAHSRCPS